MKSSLEIAQEHELQPIVDIARAAGLEDDEIELYGRYKAKIELSASGAPERPARRQDHRRHGDHADAGRRGQDDDLGLARRRASARSARSRCCASASRRSGPIFGIKGGAAGGGFAQVVPMEDLNLHFTGDIHAITAANNLLAAFVDAHVLHGHEPKLDPCRSRWRRVRRHQRPQPARHRDGPRRQAQRHPAPDGLRHHGRLRGDGDHGLASRPAATCGGGSATITVGHDVRGRARDGRADPLRRRDGRRCCATRSSRT